MRRVRAFSLIELLVVSAIIALLLSILLPSLSTVRQQGRLTQCLSHLTQIGHAWNLYANNNSDVFPAGRPAAEFSGGSGNSANWYEVGNGYKYRPRWIAMIGPYAGLNPFDNPKPADERQDYSSKVFQCLGAPDWSDERNHAYGYNHQFLGNGRKAAGKFYNFPVNRSRLVSFAGTVMVADTMGTAAGLPAASRMSYSNNGTNFAQVGNHGSTLDPPRLTPASDRGTGDAGSPHVAVDPRHLTRTNALFCDGHGESVRPEKLGYRIKMDGAYEADGGATNPPSNRLFSGTGRDDDPPPIPTS